MRSVLRRWVAGVAVLCLVTTGAWTAQADERALPGGTTRLAGDNRYETSVAVSARSFAPPVDAVYVATGTQFADALAGGPAAARSGGPVLLVQPDRIPRDVAAELDRLQPRTIYVLGNDSAVGDEVVADLREHAGSVVRLGGTDRYATAAHVSRNGWSDATTVFLASGTAFADALSGGAAAAHRDAPLLLTPPGQLASATVAELARLSPDRVYVLGGPSAVSDHVLALVGDAVPGASVRRLSGADRYATSAKVAETLWPEGSATMFFATGSEFADALSGTPAAHVNGAPMILTKRDCLPSAVWSTRAQFSPRTTAVLGGTRALTTAGATQQCGVMRYSGTGDDVVRITKPGGSHEPAIVTATHRGGSNFIVWGLDRDRTRVDLLVNVIGDYDGRTLLDEMSVSTELEIQADGPWKIEVRPLSAARRLSGSATGTGDEVLSWGGSSATATIRHRGESNVIVWSHDPDELWGMNLMVNEIGDYDGTVRVPAGSRIIEVQADGTWSVTLR